MPNYNGKLIRKNVPVSEQVINQILQDAPKDSVAMTRFRRVPMSKNVTRQPVLASFPMAYWVSGDDGLKQTSTMGWKNVYMTAEELAVLVPIPDALIDDSDIPLWSEIQPRISETIGKLIDQATLFGVNKPATWPTAIVDAATAAGNVVAEGTGKDLGVDVASLAKKVTQEGFTVNGFASEPGLNWELIGLRDANGQPVYHAPITEGQPSTLYGLGLNEVLNGAWDSTKAKIIEADWNSFALGIRRDLTFDLFDQMIISDDSGKVIFNAPQQDSKILRANIRVGFSVANPMTQLAPNEATRYPAGVITPKAPKAPGA